MALHGVTNQGHQALEVSRVHDALRQRPLGRISARGVGECDEKNPPRDAQVAPTAGEEERLNDCRRLR